MSTDQQPDSLADGKGWDGSRGARKTNPNDPAEPVPPTGAAWTHDEDDECPRCSKGKLKKIILKECKTMMLCENCGYDVVDIDMDLVRKDQETSSPDRIFTCIRELDRYEREAISKLLYNMTWTQVKKQGDPVKITKVESKCNDVFDM